MKKLLLLTSLLMLLFSCVDYPDNCTVKNTHQLNGSWFMQSSFNGFGAYESDLSENYILFTFNTGNNTLNIVNYYQEYAYGPNLNEQFPTGEYSFTYTENEISIDIESDYLTSFNYEFENGNLILKNHPEADGPLITFIPKEQSCINNPLEELQWLNNIKIAMEQNMNSLRSQIIQYVYNGECVYSINHCINCSDSMTQIYNTQGEVVCEFGGIAGLNTCPDFYETATNKRYLFNNYHSSCDEPVLLSEYLYNNVSEEPTIINLYIDGNCLNITYFAGGCDGNSWVVKLIDAEEIVTDAVNPPQRYLRLSIENTEMCEAAITQQKSFNLSELQDEGNQVILNIQNQQILYEY